MLLVTNRCDQAERALAVLLDQNARQLSFRWVCSSQIGTGVATHARLLIHIDFRTDVGEHGSEDGIPIFVVHADAFHTPLVGNSRNDMLHLFFSVEQHAVARGTGNHVTHAKRTQLDVLHQVLLLHVDGCKRKEA
ncbi:MAG: hypothetical protein C4326_15315 [Ignavibacteria bacterium]